jgi:hypothetical protein
MPAVGGTVAAAVATWTIYFEKQLVHEHRRFVKIGKLQ